MLRERALLTIRPPEDAVSEFRLLADEQGHAPPLGAPCPQCGKAIGGLIEGSVRYSAAYLSGGAVLLCEDGRAGHGSDRLRAYLSVGVLDESGSSERTDIAVVEYFQGGQ